MPRPGSCGVVMRFRVPHREIDSLKSRGYNTTEIAKKIDVTKSYVVGTAHLLKNGEERLLHAVDKGRIPLSVAMQIANADEDGVSKPSARPMRIRLSAAANCSLSVAS